MGYVENVGMKSGTKEYMVPDLMRNLGIAVNAGTLAASKTENVASVEGYATIAAEKIGHMKNWKDTVQVAKCYVPTAQSVDFTDKEETFCTSLTSFQPKKWKKMLNYSQTSVHPVRYSLEKMVST